VDLIKTIPKDTVTFCFFVFFTVANMISFINGVTW
jgi:hypothetical protein